MQYNRRIHGSVEIMSKIEGVILDWAGTTVDFGCFAPVNVFVDIFKHAGINVTMEEARAPMGMLKIDHIRAMLSMPRISKLWEEQYGVPFNEQDVEKLYAEFEPALLASLSEYTDPIPEVIETVQVLRNQGLKIGSTTGYTDSMMDVVIPNALKKRLWSRFLYYTGWNEFSWKTISLYDLSKHGSIKIICIMEGCESR